VSKFINEKILLDFSLRVILALKYIRKYILAFNSMNKNLSTSITRLLDDRPIIINKSVPVFKDQAQELPKSQNGNIWNLL
jgi:hypothetical protein